MYAEPHASFSGAQMRQEKRSVAGMSVLAAVAITLFKAIVGFMTGSLGILSEAAHSGLDLVAAVVTLFSVRVSDKPADADHQYGHGKVENFSAFIEMALLLITCVWIIYEAINRLFISKVEIEPTVAAFVVMGISIAVDIWRSQALYRVAVKYDSQALHADALHFKTDIWSSTVVIIGLAAVLVGQKMHIGWLSIADPLAALGVAGVVISVSMRLARDTVDALLDAAPTGARAQIQDAVCAVEGVLEVDRVRIRRAGNHYFVDLTLGLARGVTFQRSEQVTAEVVASVRNILPEADVVVHALPRATMQENIFDRIRAVAARSNLLVHDMSVQDLHGNLHVEQHIEMDERLSLRDAHDRVTALEAEMRREVPEIDSILTHIESEPATVESGAEQHDGRLEKRLQSIAQEFRPEVVDVHDVLVKHMRDKIYVSCHCTMKDDLPLARVHHLATELEIRFKQKFPELFRVLIHTEPLGDNRR